MRTSAVLFLATLTVSCVTPQDAVTTTGAPRGTESPSTTVTDEPSTSTSASTSTTAEDTTTTTEVLAPLAGLTLTPLVEADFPMVVVPWTDGNSLVALRGGGIHTFDGTSLSDDPILSFSVPTNGERGLLGMATAPDRPGTVFVHYSGGSGETVVSRVDVSSGTETVLLTVDQPAANHNGGTILFAPDGSLLLGLGDGGGANDAFGHGQNTDTLLGGIVRIDPEDGGGELWSHGLRNPFRMWLDGDDLYIGDVGQNAYEEIDVVSVTGGPYDFGWPITEGLHCFSPRSGCDTDGITLPVLEVAHGDAGTCSITGGAVYRGTAIPEFDGRYFYSDFCGGWLRSFVWDGTAATESMDHTGEVGSAGGVVGMGHGPDGELLVLTTAGILRLDPVR